MSGAEFFVEGSKTAQANQPAGEPFGHVHSVTGSTISVELVSANSQALQSAGLTVGKFVKIAVGKSLLVGVIADVSAQDAMPARGQGHRSTAHVDLVGEISERGASPARFRRGVTDYPSIG